MTSGELARALKLDAGTLTPMLKRLAVAGLIERTRRAEDARVIDNKLSEKGRALQDGLIRAQSEVKCRTGLLDEDLHNLRESLHRLSENLSTDINEDFELT